MNQNSNAEFFKTSVLGHPSLLFVLFFTEMWERFSYYGMRAILVIFLTGIIIAGFIYYTGIMASRGEIEVNSFFSFLTAMMLSYQPIRSLATINMLFYQGAAAAERVFEVIDTKIKIKEVGNLPDLKINKGKKLNVIALALQQKKLQS